MPPSVEVKIADVKATVFLVRQEEKQSFQLGNGGRLLQGIDLTLSCKKPLPWATVTAAFGGEARVTELRSVPAGDSVHRVWIPETKEPAALTLTVAWNGGGVSTKRDWTPPRHWVVYLNQTAHFDPGYTGLPSDVMAEYLEYLDRVVEYCEMFEDWPISQRFHYTIEQAWIAQHYVENRPPEQIERFIKYCREGRIQVTALYGNMILELMGSEEMARLVYPAFRLKRKYHIPIRCAHHTDIPGISWGLATLLASVGVEFFVPGIPDYFGLGQRQRTYWDDNVMRPGGAPSFFFWEAPNGRRILFHAHKQANGGIVDPSLCEIPDLLEDADLRGYGHDFIRCQAIGGIRDNAPPNLDFCIGARAWNEKYAYPEIRVATDLIFYLNHHDDLKDSPTFRGDFPGTDYCVGATSTAGPLGVSREGRDLLAAAERFAAVAAGVSDYPYPTEDFVDAYNELLKFDEHVWGVSCPFGPGEEASVAETTVYAQHARSAAHSTLIRAANKVVDRIGLESGAYVVVFNPSQQARTDVAHVEWRAARPAELLMIPTKSWEGREFEGRVLTHGHAHGRGLSEMGDDLTDGRFDLIDVATGKRVPYQIERLGSALEPSLDAGGRASLGMARPEYLYSFHFLAEDVPAVGYRAYKIVPRKTRARFPRSIKVTRTTLENGFYRVELCPKSGAVISIYDKELGRELVDATAGVGVNQFLARGVTDGKISLADRSDIRVKRRGPCSASLLITGDAPGCPQRAQEIIVYAGVKRIDFHNRILKDAAADQQIHYAFPLAVPKPRFRLDAPLVAIRPIADQLPGTCTDYYAVQRWVSVTEGDGGWGVLWSSKHAPVVRLSELWPDYVSQAHHNFTPPGFVHDWLTDPEQLERGHIYSYVLTNNFITNFCPSQVGDILSFYSLTTHAGDFDAARAREFGEMTALPLYPVVKAGEEGSDASLPPVGAFFEIDSPDVQLLTIKRAEDGRGWVVRLLNNVDRDVRVKLRPLFVKNAHVAYLANIAEEVTGPVLDSVGGVVTVDIGAMDVATIRMLPPEW